MQGSIDDINYLVCVWENGRSTMLHLVSFWNCYCFRVTCLTCTYLFEHLVTEETQCYIYIVT